MQSEFCPQRSSTIYYILSFSILFLYFAPSFFSTTVFSPLLCFSQHSEYALSFRPSALSSTGTHFKVNLQSSVEADFNLLVGADPFGEFGELQSGHLEDL